MNDFINNISNMTNITKIKLSVLCVLTGVLAVVVTIRYNDIKNNFIAWLSDNESHVYVEHKDGRTFIVDNQKERFDVTYALDQGYQLNRFEFGIGKDSIAPIMKPEFAKPGDEKFEKFSDDAKVLAAVIDGQARAYPLGLLHHHEVVNDTISGVPIAAAYCPLAALGAIYKREASVGEITIGTSGWTYQRTFMLYDHTTDSLWYPYQDGLRSIGGELRDEVLPLMEFEQTAWKDWKAQHPETWLCIGGETPQTLASQPLDEMPETPEEAETPPMVGSGVMR